MQDATAIDHADHGPSWSTWLRRALLALTIVMFCAVIVIAVARERTIAALHEEVNRLLVKQSALTSEMDMMRSIHDTRLDAIERAVFGDIIARLPPAKAQSSVSTQTEAILHRRLREQEVRIQQLERWRIYGNGGQ